MCMPQLWKQREGKGEEEKERKRKRVRLYSTKRPNPTYALVTGRYLTLQLHCDISIHPPLSVIFAAYAASLLSCKYSTLLSLFPSHLAYSMQLPEKESEKGERRPNQNNLFQEYFLSIYQIHLVLLKRRFTQTSLCLLHHLPLISAALHKGKYFVS